MYIRLKHVQSTYMKNPIMRLTTKKEERKPLPFSNVTVILIFLMQNLGLSGSGRVFG